jgi:hypothetical protein
MRRFKVVLNTHKDLETVELNFSLFKVGSYKGMPVLGLLEYSGLP